jgi:tRNA A-37 threonylcarbamoyl transferase component Bud32
MLIGNDFDTEVGQLIVEKYLGRGKSGDSYLVNLNERNYVLKIMHDEKVGYYQWNKSKLTDEIKSYKTLSKLRVPIPKLHYADFEKNFLIKDYINGNIASKIIAEKRITELHIQKLFEISNHLKKHNINIDYFPNNFVFTNKTYLIKNGV